MNCFAAIETLLKQGETVLLRREYTAVVQAGVLYVPITRCFEHHHPRELNNITELPSTFSLRLSCPDWSAVPRGVVDGDPRVEVNTHVSHPLFDTTDAACISTAARAINVLDWVCDAPPGILSVEDIPPVVAMRGLMWRGP